MLSASIGRYQTTFFEKYRIGVDQSSLCHSGDQMGAHGHFARYEHIHNPAATA